MKFDGMTGFGMMRMIEAIADELRKFADIFHADLNKIRQNGRKKNLETSFERNVWVITGCYLGKLEQNMDDNLDGQNDNIRKHQTDTSPWNAVSGSAKKQSGFYYADEDSLLLQMCVKDFGYRPDLTGLKLSPGWDMIEDEPLQKRDSLKQVIQTGNMCQLDEYWRDDCFEVWSTSQNDMQQKSVLRERYEKESLDGQNENVRKHQTDTSPGNDVTDTAPEQSDVHDEDVDEEIRALEQLLMCKVCLDKDSCIVFFPCRHMATCESCEQFLQRCPVCRSEINEAVKINE